MRENAGLPVLLLELLLLIVIVLLDLPWLLWVEILQHAVQLLVTTDVLKDLRVLMSRKVRSQVGQRRRLTRQCLCASPLQAMSVSCIQDGSFLFI